jgi:diaminopimelate decarboxylase
MSIPELAAPYWKSNEHGELLAGDLTISSLAARHGTPLFIYDRGVLEQKYFSLRNTLPAKFEIFYSVKANPNAAFLKFFLEKGCGLEVASGGELQLAERAGCPPEKIVFAGPGKTEPELKLAITQGIGEIHAESELEIGRISSISAEVGCRTCVALRINPNEEGQGGAMRMGGKAAPFGVDEERMEPLLRRIASDPRLDFCGIHLFAGTQILDYKFLLAQYRKGLQIGQRAAALLAAPLRTLDFGGGLGIPYFPGDSELDLGQFAVGLRELLNSTLSCGLTTTRFMIEPGRFLVGEAGVYVARINDMKVSRGKKYLILDGGMNHHLAASGNLGQVIKRNFPMVILNKVHVPVTETVDVVGPLCTPLDTLGRSVQLPAAEVGDLVGIFQSGAYGLTASPLSFLSHAPPPEVWVESQRDFLIRSSNPTVDYLATIPQMGVNQPV